MAKPYKQDYYAKIQCTEKRHEYHVLIAVSKTIWLHKVYLINRSLRSNHFSWCGIESTGGYGSCSKIYAFSEDRHGLIKCNI